MRRATKFPIAKLEEQQLYFEQKWKINNLIVKQTSFCFLSTLISFALTVHNNKREFAMKEAILLALKKNNLIGTVKKLMVLKIRLRTYNKQKILCVFVVHNVI